MMRFLMLFFIMFSAVACSVQVDSDKSSNPSDTGNLSLNPLLDLGEPPLESELQVNPNAQTEDYVVFGVKVNANSGSGITSNGLFCANYGKVTEFRCGLGNPGEGWVEQPGVCYHILTGDNCDCSVGNNWWDEAVKSCEGTTLKITDTCGYEKTVTNWPECAGDDRGIINTFSRQTVIDAYNERYKKSTPAIDWNGDIGACIAGTTSLDYQQRVIDQINYYRAMVGIGPVTLTADGGAHQAGAALMSRNGRLSHSPDDTWECFDEMKPFASGSSNIAIGAAGNSAIDLYIDDPGANNGAVGHRRWLLHPTKTTFSTGDVPSSRSNGKSYRAANHIGVFFGGNQPSTVDYVAWPNAGFVPYTVLPNGSNRWSFSKNASFSNATVSFKNITDGIEYDVTLEAQRTGYGVNTLVFKPTGFSYKKPSRDTTYEIYIKDVRVGGEDRDFLYRVIVIDPNS